MCTMAIRIKKCRLENNLTQEELAEKLGLKKSAVAKYENGRVENIKRSTIEEMARIFDCTPSYLMGWDDMNTTVAAHKDCKKLKNTKNCLLQHGRRSDSFDL